jgi:hypothetical protein
VTRTQQLAVTITCLVAALTYAGAVTTWALALFVLPGVAGAALLAWPFVARGFPGTTTLVVGLLVLGWAELANIWTGLLNGPAARSTLFAGGWTVIAVVLAQSRWPALFLGAVAGLVAGALVLGAAGEVELVVVAAALCAALTLGSIERSRRNWTAGARRGAALLLLSLLAVAAAAGAVLLQAQHDPRHPYLLTQGKDYPGLKPAFSDPLSKESSSLNRSAHQRSPRTASAGSKPPPHRPHTQRPHTPPPHTHRPHHSTRPQQQATPPHHPPVQNPAPRSRTLLYVLAGILLFLLVVAALIGARLLATRLRWRRLRRRLTAGAPADQVTGAWAWTRVRLDACRLPLAADVSPDAIAAGRAMKDLPPDVFLPLQTLAAATTTAAFSRDRSLGDAEVAAAWSAAGNAGDSARDLLTRLGRARLAFRGPATTPIVGSRR